MKILKELLYTKNHEWIKVEGNKGYVGITDFAQHALGSIVYVELPEVGTEFKKGDTFGVIESVKAASDIYLPIDGKVLEANDIIVENPELVNEDSYVNWMVCIDITDSSQLDDLLSSDAYEELCSKEE